MCDEDGESKRKRFRGPYKKYLEPGETLKMPDSTLRSRAMRAEQLQKKQSEDIVGRVIRDERGQRDEPRCAHQGLGGGEREELQEREFNSPSPGLEQLGVTSASDEVTELSAPHLCEDDGASESEEEPRSACHVVCVCGQCNVNEESVEEPASGDTRKDRYEWDEVVHPSLTTTKFEIFIMLFHLFIQHKMSYALVEDILRFINVILGSNILRTSEYIFRKLFKPKSKIFKHIVCSHCQLYLGEIGHFQGQSTIDCECGSTINVKQLDGNYFLTFSVGDLLKYLFQRPDLKVIPPNEHQHGQYCDVMDGELYQEKVQSEIRSGKNCLTLTFNTDGAKVFHSRKGSMWPLQFIVNEIDPNERFKDANVFLCGLWYGKGAPDMSAFLKPFIGELVDLGTNGIELVTSNGSKLLYHVFAPICSVDSGAKPKILRMKSHNGKFGCGFCLHPNLPVPGYPANQLRYLTKDSNNTSLNFPYRTHATMVTDMLKADELDREGNLRKRHVGTDEETLDHVQGMYGISCTAELPKFDVVFSFIIDYLHTLLLGVMAAMIKFWFDSKDHRDPQTHDPPSELKTIDDCLSSIKPPQAMATRTRLMSDRAEWMGKELRLFAIFYSLPVLEGLRKFSGRHFSHLQKFVSALQVLLGSVISEDQLNYAENLLEEFVNEYEELYGSIHMTLNIHLVKHVTCLVRKWCPLWCYSNFCFESGNGRLSRLVRGTKGVMSQICQKYISVLTASDFIQNHNINERVLLFCQEVMGYQYAKKSTKFFNATGLGSENVFCISDEERVAFSQAGYDFAENSHISYFNRIIYNGTVYYSKAYAKPQVYDDTCVKLLDGSYALTEKFVNITNETDLFVIVRALQLSTMNEKLAPFISTGAFHFFGSLKVINITEIVGKCVIIQFEDKNYVCDIPQTYERD